ncbi:ATP-dependent DNA helicase PIF1 [Colletotrichum musicola]|uniref:ATP-dependent DNA helicase n=1 Tax=Colletotrichum musicola TaxID=2175873 RepID=A0A8H6U6C9_9PEZI|nr:ATP-dependent DNA helicase PIF1 [Colletotrichum musicola]
MARTHNRQGSGSFAAPPAKRARTGGGGNAAPSQREKDEVAKAMTKRFLAEHKNDKLPKSWKPYYIVVKGDKPGIYRYWFKQDAIRAGVAEHEADAVAADPQTKRSKGALYKKVQRFEQIDDAVLELEKRRDPNDRAIGSVSSAASASSSSVAPLNRPFAVASASSFNPAPPLVPVSRPAHAPVAVPPALELPEAGEDFIPLEDDDESDAVDVEKERPRGPPLCPEQQEAMDLVMEGHNIFITGSGGCGKSVLVKAFYDRFREMGKTVYLLAPTGQAVVNIGGRTTYNYAGWGIDYLRKSPEKLTGMSYKTHIRKQIRNTDALIIDEISMVENEFFTRLSKTMSMIREDRSPFGGVQMIVVGDFCQLPPVCPFDYCTQSGCGKKTEEERVNGVVYAHVCKTNKRPTPGHPIRLDRDKWAFKSTEWKRCRFETVNLTTIHRQQDEKFIRVLQKCRRGEELQDADCHLLLNHPAEVGGGVCLFGTNRDVDNYNEMKLERMSSQEVRYEAWDFFQKSSELVDLEELRQERYAINKASPPTTSIENSPSTESHRYSELLRMKVGMPVMLLANVDLEIGLCNGSQGTVCGFVPSSQFEGPNRPQRSNYDGDEASFRVAMCRYKGIRNFQVDQLPEVKFANGLTRVVGPDCTVVEVGSAHPYSLESRTQIPLAPAWALSIHKSQGVTLDRVTVDLKMTFAKGQAYVALSRARSLQGLKIENNISLSKLRSSFELDEDVRRFMMKIGALGDGTEEESDSDSDECRELALND